MTPNESNLWRAWGAVMRIYSSVVLLVIIFGLTVGHHSLRAQSLQLMDLKQNLDLPFNGGLVERDRIRFYGSDYELDGIFYVIDRSGSMQSSGELQIAKREVVENIGELSPEVQFGIVFFDRGITKFPSSGRPADANAAMKAAAINYIQSVPGGGGSCVQQGLVEALLFANLSTAERKVLLYVGDGGGTCNGANEQTYLSQTLSVVTSQNHQRTQIDSIGVLDLGVIHEDFLQTLSHMNYGVYRKITR